VILTLTPGAAQDEFVDYLRRLGCAVSRIDADRLEVFVEYADTVEDEDASILDWCGSWAAARTGGVRPAAAAA
jgi:hypothetical protein